ncbi:MAG: DnaD domain protein [Lachnospiraceae bacterium]|nr:DnaD domain protein [Lachnospiraceae bacterium]
MDHILLCTNHVPLVTSIYNTFIEQYMPAANGSYVKVYLYLAMCLQSGEQNLSISSLADRMENTEKDILRALLYWEKKHLLQINRDKATGEIIGLEMLLPEDTSGTQKRPTDATKSESSSYDDSKNTKRSESAFNDVSESAAIDVTANSSAAYSRNHDASGINGNEYSSIDHAAENPATPYSKIEEIADHVPDEPETVTSPAADNDTADTADVETAASIRDLPSGGAPSGKVNISVSPQQLQALSSNEDFIWLCNVVESYLERPMKPNEIQLISYLYGTLHFSKELVLHLYDYCISMGKTNCNYIQTVALSWHEQGISTPEEAQNASVRYHASYTAVSKALALGRALADIEKKFVDRWSDSWNMDLSVIIEACNRTVLKIHHADFKYTEGILSHWREEGVHTLQDVEQSDANYAQAQETTKRKTSSAPKQPDRSRNQFQNFRQRDVSTEELQELERKLLMQ